VEMEQFLGLLPPLESDLGRVADVLGRYVLDGDDLRAQVVNYYLTQAPGGLARPALALTAAYAGQSSRDLAPASDDVVTVAAAIELLNTGTLYQDDVLDGDDLRRGVPSANAKWGDGPAILAGDHLMFSSLALSLELDMETTRDLLMTTFALFRGEMKELEDRHRLAVTQAAYLESVSGKQASLTACACTLGARLGGLTEGGVKALGQYGYELGMAGQIIDDIMDLTSATEFMGKPMGSDLRAGIYTLPVIFALQVSAELEDLLHAGVDDDNIARAIELVATCGALEQARTTAGNHIRDATAALGSSPLNDGVVDVLCSFAQEILTGACWRE
jgi:geranylgeranyl pyrophosphate synthase